MCLQNPVSNPFLSHSCRSRSINLMWASQREHASVWSVRSVCQINSCYPLYYLPTVSGPTANLVFKTSRESIEIHHWSIPHCGQPQQFNIQHSKLNIALRASVCQIIFVLSALFVFKKIHGDIRVQKSRVQNILWEHRNSSLVNSTLRPAATIQHSTFKSQNCAPRLRVLKIYSC